jgi:peptide/nickel transport system permease protein
MTAEDGVRGILRRVAKSVTGLSGMVIVAFILVAAALAPFVSPHDPDAINVLNRFSGPTLTHWLGTDHLGRDLASRLMHGSTVAMAVALAAISIAVVVGVTLGILAAYLSARWERVILILFDVILSFPSLILALAIVAVFGPSTIMVVIIVAITLIPQFGRVARAQVLTLKSAPFLEAERILGASHGRLIVSHILPNIVGPIVVLASMDIPVVITIEAGLSFLGLGVRPPQSSWGTLIQDGYQYLSDSWIPVIIASAALTLATLGFTLFGEALRDAADPRLNRER